MATGDLEVMVLQGQGLKDIESFGKQDPYCTLELSGQKFKTKTKTDGGKNPVWNERFKFVNISPQYATELAVKVFDHNVMLSDKEIGAGRLALTRLYHTGTEEVRVPLVTPKGKASGEVQMVVTFRPYH
ncbi:hypothetical protein N2152v2_007291 [Parachlorella kessleri]